MADKLKIKINYGYTDDLEIELKVEQDVVDEIKHKIMEVLEKATANTKLNISD